MRISWGPQAPFTLKYTLFIFIPRAHYCWIYLALTLKKERPVIYVSLYVWISVYTYVCFNEAGHEPYHFFSNLKMKMKKDKNI